MSNKKKSSFAWDENDPHVYQQDQPEEYAAMIAAEQAEKEVINPLPGEVKIYFTEFLWKGVLPGYRCSTCSHCESGAGSKDRIILHILNHEPEAERNALLDKLIKE